MKGNADAEQTFTIKVTITADAGHAFAVRETVEQALVIAVEDIGTIDVDLTEVDIEASDLGELTEDQRDDLPYEESWSVFNVELLD